MGTNFSQKTLQLDFNKRLSLEICDPKSPSADGSEIQKPFHLNYAFTQIAFVLYDITSSESFEDARNWIKSYKEYCKISLYLLVLIGTKLDKELFRKVQREDAKQLARAEGALFFEVSAKTGEQIKFSMYEAVRKYTAMFEEKNHMDKKTFV